MTAQEARELALSTKGNRVETQYNAIVDEIKRMAKAGAIRILLYSIYEENKERFMADGFTVETVENNTPKCFFISW